MACKRKRNALDLEQKVFIIREIESGKKQSVIALAQNIAKTTVNLLCGSTVPKLLYRL